MEIHQTVSEGNFKWTEDEQILIGKIRKSTTMSASKRRRKNEDNNSYDEDYTTHKDDDYIIEENLNTKPNEQVTL